MRECGGGTSTYTTHITSERNQAVDQMTDLVMRDFVDVKYLRSHSPRKPTLPSLDLVVWKRMAGGAGSGAQGFG